VNITERYLAILGPQLTARDHEIMRIVNLFKLATGEQLERLFFADCAETSRARGRQAVLRRLTDHGVLQLVGHEHRTNRQRRSIGGVGGGSRGYVYTLGVAGQRLAATGGTRPRRQLSWYEPAVAHMLAITELYVRLTEAEHREELRLNRFEAEPICWRPFEDRTLKPDAYVEVDFRREGRRYRGPFFIEVDRANQYGTKISTKVPQYLAYYDYERLRQRSEVQAGTHFPRVLFLAPTPARENYLKELINHAARAHALFRVAQFDDALTALQS
jgi:hypothetical protein